MSASAAAAAAAAVSRKVIVVVGACGTGKSTLIDTLLPAEVPAQERPQISDSPYPVTTQTRSYGSMACEYHFIDTVGTDKDGFRSVLPKELVDGCDVHFVVLLRSDRWKQEYEQILGNLEWAKPRENVTKWVSTNSRLHASSSVNASSWDSAQIPPAIMYLRESVFSSLKFSRVTFPAPPVAPRPIRQAAVVQNGSAKSKAVLPVVPVTPRTEAERLFRTDSPAASQVALCELWLDMHWVLPKKQKKMGFEQWLTISADAVGFGLLKKHRETGDRLLAMHLLVTNPGSREAEALAMSERIFKEVVCKHGLQQHIETLYQHGTQLHQQLTDEKYADYIEALFYLFLTKIELRSYVVNFLHELGAAI